MLNSVYIDILMLFHFYVYHRMFSMDIFSVSSSSCLNPNARPFVPVCNRTFSVRKKFKPCINMHISISSILI